MNSSRRLLLAMTALAVALPLHSSRAADGYFLGGYGPRQKALSGAGTADNRDAMTLSVNPAGIVGLERQFQLGLTALHIDRGYDTEGAPAVLAPGHVQSGRPWFPVPNIGFIQPITEDSAWSIAAYANGGINTSYSWGHWRPPFGGPFGGGFGGIDLQQTFFSVGYAQRFHTSYGPITIGIAPTIAAQMMNIQGLRVFAPYSSNMWKLSDMAFDWSFGGGVKAGILWSATDRLRFGFSGTTPIWMSRFDKYAGIVADYGRFDIPAQMQAGFAYDVMPNLTVMMDWRHIFYSAVPALGNPLAPITVNSLGHKSGPGFDWTDTDSGAVGVEWRYSPTLTVRAGYHYTTNPLRARSVTFNAFAPIINKHQASFGFNYAVTRNSSIDFAFNYGFRNSVSGPEYIPQQFGLPLGVYNPAATIKPYLEGMEISVGYNYKWDKGDNSWIPSHF